MKIAISIGDVNGIGLEVILKSLTHEAITSRCTPIIYGSSKVVSYHKNVAKVNDLKFKSAKDIASINQHQVNVINCWDDEVQIDLGNVSESGGLYAQKSLQAAVEDLKRGHVDALVTAPIHKHAMALSGFKYPGHTEYLAHEMGSSNQLMSMIGPELRMGLVTNHVPISQIADLFNRDLLLQKIKTMLNMLKADFGFEKPRLAVLGLNPHAGDQGSIGNEEVDFISNVILEQKKQGSLVYGPYAADGFFGSGQYKKFDGVLAMYHDQGLVPFKLLSFGQGVNFTAGLPYVRTSPDHGTGHDIAGQNKANPSSFTQAMFLAMDVVKQRTS